jgi:hypothetical protein
VRLNAERIDGVTLSFVSSRDALAVTGGFEEFLNALRALLSTPAAAYTPSTMFV